ncbi:MAG: hypothetical protein ABI193_24300 [Minicystis sp.]
MRRLLLSLAALVSLAGTACTGSATPPPSTPPQSAPPRTPTAALPTAGPEAFTIDGALKEEWMPLLKAPAIDPAKTKLASPPPALAAAPASCEAFVQRKGAGKPACADAASALGALATALDQGDPTARDTALVDLEGCAGLMPGIVRALRAELAPIACAEALTAPALKAPPATMSGLVYHALLGQAIASRLARAATGAPTLAPPYTRPRVVEFTNGPMKTWFTEQALVIQEVSQAAVELPYYAKGITAVEAGVAEMRLVETIRDAPLPDEIAKNADLRNEYYGSLDQGLDPRKDRGRDAALVGLRELALVGVIHDARVDRARALLSRIYGGRRIDALDALALPALAKAAPTSVEERLAAKLPTFYAGLLLDEQAGSRAGTMRQLLEKGVPLPQRSALRTATLTPETRSLTTRARIELGRLYWRAVDFDQAAALASTWTYGVERSEDTTLLLGLAIALRGGPEDAADMMRKAPLALSAMGKVAALDYLAQKAPPGADAGIAAFDAALIKQITAPQGADKAYWSEVSARFQKASSLLGDPALKGAADERAKAATLLAGAAR